MLCQQSAYFSSLNCVHSIHHLIIVLFFIKNTPLFIFCQIMLIYKIFIKSRIRPCHDTCRYDICRPDTCRPDFCRPDICRSRQLQI
uniref:Uncharacterized protein n=1 Tax=Meloidogyne enterolobii TaxID=390850 RepID=A0A6V7XUE3_MELEN|nr:unnamed protein product [Meloidogyne enterolobii]